jgi:hypothetical protein
MKGSKKNIKKINKKTKKHKLKGGMAPVLTDQDIVSGIKEKFFAGSVFDSVKLEGAYSNIEPKPMPNLNCCIL